MSATVIKLESLSSSFYAGTGKETEKVFGEVIGKIWDAAVDFTKSALDKIKSGFEKFKARGITTLVDFMRSERLQKTTPGNLLATGAVLAIGVVVVTVAVAVAPTVAGLALAIGAPLIGGLVGLAKLYWTLTGATGLIGLVGTATIGWVYTNFVRATSFLWNFNWNLSDKELSKQQEQLLNQLYGLTGAAMGQVLGTTLCGAGAGLFAVQFNPIMAVHIGKELGQEALEEVLSAVWALAEGTKRIVTGWVFRESFKQIRRFVKWVASKLPGGGPNFLKKWGDEGRQPWVFSQKFEDAIESIPNQQIRQFAENFFDELFDSCGEIILVTGNIASGGYG